MSEYIEPQQKARLLVVEFFNTEGDLQIDTDDTNLVFFAYILGGWKATVATTVRDHKYYEVTHNIRSNETYLDVYVKIVNKMFDSDHPINSTPARGTSAG